MYWFDRYRDDGEKVFECKLEARNITHEYIPSNTVPVDVVYIVNGRRVCHQRFTSISPETTHTRK